MSNDKDIYEVKVLREIDETQKAVKLQLQIVANGILVKKKPVWLPKSQVAVIGNMVRMPRWLVQAKTNELAEMMGVEVKIIGTNISTMQLGHAVETFTSGSE